MGERGLRVKFMLVCDYVIAIPLLHELTEAAAS